MIRCRICGEAATPYMDFGPMPPANGFLLEEELRRETFHDLSVAFCPGCTASQLVHVLPPRQLFHEAYPFFTSTSARMGRHFHRLAAQILREIPERGFVVEVGSNDGTLLEPLARAGVRHLGVDPSANVAQMARRRGVETMEAFFDEDVARNIVDGYGQADVIVAANCFCHVADLRSLARGLEILLKPDGRVIFEDPYVGDIVRQCAYDQMYDEHVFYFSVTSVSRWVEGHGLQVVDVAPVPVHGGSMRYTLARHGRCNVSPQVEAWRQRELQAGLDRLETYQGFASRVRRSREQLTELLERLHSSGKRVVGYGATSKSTTVTNYCGLTRELVEFISDTTPEKQGRFSPGVHIPVRPHAEFARHPSDYALLFAWNHAEEIFAKESAFVASGGRWITYVPEVAIR